jgi:hypothetical protein
MLVGQQKVHLVGLDARGGIVLREKIARATRHCRYVLRHQLFWSNIETNGCHRHPREDINGLASRRAVDLYQWIIARRLAAAWQLFDFR